MHLVNKKSVVKRAFNCPNIIHIMELDQRKTLRVLWDNGTRDPQVLNKLTGASLAMCYRSLKKFEAGEGVQRRQGSGRPSKFKENDKRRVSMLAHHHPKWSAAKIGAKAKV
jgi:transposase